jgi:hypothetical protein
MAKLKEQPPQSPPTNEKTDYNLEKKRLKLEKKSKKNEKVAPIKK